MLISKVIKSAIAVACTALTVQSHAAGGGMATEFTQVANNVELATGVSQQIKTVAQLAQQYAVQLQQFKEQLLAGAPTQVMSVVSTIDGVRKELAAVGRYQQSLVQAGSSVQQLQTLISQRQAQAKLANMPFEQYVAVQAAMIERGDLRAKQRLKNETEVMSQVNEDLSFASQQSSQISGTLGVHQAVNLLNKQMNRMVLQNARVLTLMAQERGSEAAEREHEKNVSREAVQNLTTDLNGKEQAAKQQSTSDVSSFRNSNPGLFR